MRILNNNGYDLAGSGRAWYTVNRDGLHGLVRIEPGSAEIADVAPAVHVHHGRAGVR